MKLTDELKAQIDALSYEDLLSRWRYSPVGDKIFQDESGEYWAKRMAELSSRPGGNSVAVAASKAIGWDG